VVEKSTVPVRAAAALDRVLNAQRSTQFVILSNPEFLAEGTAIRDLTKPDRVLVGGPQHRAGETNDGSSYQQRCLQESSARYSNPIVYDSTPNEAHCNSESSRSIRHRNARRCVCKLDSKRPNSGHQPLVIRALEARSERVPGAEGEDMSWDPRYADLSPHRG
jgi:hypothetical protein